MIVVANRLPLQIKRNASVAGGWEYSVSSGGMVSALLGVRGVRMVWVGWCAVDDATPAEQARLRRTLWKTQGILPIFVDKRTAELHYNGFCNDVLWPNFHYVVARTPGEETAAGATEQEAWAAYRAVNEQFAEAVRSILRPGDTVWVHDYHLMLLPSLLRKPGYDAPARLKVGWFLHTPWPSPEVFRTLPMRRQLLEGLLGADVLGFHVYDYARYFLQACTRLLGDEVAVLGAQAHDAGSANADAEHAGGGGASHSLTSTPSRSASTRSASARALASAAVRGRVAELRAQFAGQHRAARRRPRRLHQGHPAEAPRDGGAAQAHPTHGTSRLTADHPHAHSSPSTDRRTRSRTAVEAPRVHRQGRPDRRPTRPRSLDQSRARRRTASSDRQRPLFTSPSYVPIHYLDQSDRRTRWSRSTASGRRRRRLRDGMPRTRAVPAGGATTRAHPLRVCTPPRSLLGAGCATRQPRTTSTSSRA